MARCKAKNILELIHKKIKKRMFELHKMIRKNWKYLMKNVKFTYKEKIAISIFCVNSTLYQRMWG